MKFIAYFLGMVLWMATVGCQSSHDNNNAQGGYGGYQSQGQGYNQGPPGPAGTAQSAGPVILVRPK